MSVEALRGEVRAWLASNVPEGWKARQTGGDMASYEATQRDWLARLVSAGYAVPHWPEEWGGSARSFAEQVAIFEEIARAGAPRLSLSFVSLYHTAMTLLEWGTDRQKQRHLPAILRGEIWCQGFSEPSAGSDLASLRTRAERRGDHYIVNGQKIWSTNGVFADYCLLLARTDSSGAKQAGITFLLMDMKSAGVDVRPIKQITGDEEFAEIFLTDVAIPVENRVGEENQGWKVAQTTLASERGLTLVELTERLHRSIRLLAPLARDLEARRAFARVSVGIDAVRAMMWEITARRIEGVIAPGDASVVKLGYARVLREFTTLGVRLSGMKGQRFAPITLGAGYETGNWMFDFMNSYQWTIAGGSDEIQRNIISERVLGLPREKL